MIEDVAYMNRMLGNIAPVDPFFTSHFQISRIQGAIMGLCGKVAFKKILKAANLQVKGQTILRKDGTPLSPKDLRAIVQAIIQRRDHELKSEDAKESSH